MTCYDSLVHFLLLRGVPDRQTAAAILRQLQLALAGSFTQWHHPAADPAVEITLILCAIHTAHLWSALHAPNTAWRARFGPVRIGAPAASAPGSALLESVTRPDALLRDAATGGQT